MDAIGRAAVGPRRVRAENLHLTMFFAGPQSAEWFAGVAARMLAFRFEEFVIRLDTLGWWRRPGIVWLGASRPPRALAALAARVQQIGVECGAVADPKAFHGHVTLARRVRAAPAPLRQEDAIDWPVADLVLAESVAGPAGVEYRIRMSWNAGRAPGVSP